jgi:large subunit ribosomal protein L13
MIGYQTTWPTVEEQKEKWYIVDASGLVLGRLASRIASLLRGKRLARFSPHIHPNIHVIITNADKVVLTGNKLVDKIYYHHTRHRTGIKAESARHLLERKPEELIRRAVHGMCQKGPLGRQIEKHLRIYNTGEYTDQHKAQQPEPLVVKTRVPKKKA